MPKIERKMLKFELPMESEPTEIEMPPGSVIRHCDRQRRGTSIFMWAECPLIDGDTPAQPTHKRRFIINGTGQSIPDGASYIGTVGFASVSDPISPNEFVWHVFEIIA